MQRVTAVQSFVRQDLSLKQLAFLVSLALLCDTACDIWVGFKILRDTHFASLCFPKHHGPFCCNKSNSLITAPQCPNAACNAGNCARQVRNVYPRQGSLQIDATPCPKYKAVQKANRLASSNNAFISHRQRKSHSACHTRFLSSF